MAVPWPGEFPLRSEYHGFEPHSPLPLSADDNGDEQDECLEDAFENVFEDEFEEAGDDKARLGK
jgi:hypothetical protein